MNSEFNDDPVVAKEILRLRDRFGIKIVVETGTYHGATSQFFAKNFDKVYTIEIVPDIYSSTKEKLKNYSNLTCLLGNSSKVLAELLPTLDKSYPILFYLDAHWSSYWPLLDELKIIASNCYNNCVIVIDDFKVPGQNFQYDSYNNSPNDIDFILADVHRIYDKPFYYFNKRTERLSGPCVGKIYITPDKKKVKDFVVDGIYSNA